MEFNSLLTLGGTAWGYFIPDQCDSHEANGKLRIRFFLNSLAKHGELHITDLLDAVRVLV